jgi:hypothetical protein
LFLLLPNPEDPIGNAYSNLLVRNLNSAPKNLQLRFVFHSVAEQIAGRLASLRGEDEYGACLPVCCVEKIGAA